MMAKFTSLIQNSLARLFYGFIVIMLLKIQAVKAPVKLFAECCFGTKKYTLPKVKSPIPVLPLIEDELQESFVRGSGPGGQKINKNKSNVSLVHIPTGISVQCQEQRDLTSNRRIARKLLRDKIDLAMHGDESRLGRKFERIRKKKRNSAR